MEDRHFFEQQAARCRRLAGGVSDDRTAVLLRQLAEDFDLKAKAAERPEDTPTADGSSASARSEPGHGN
jgi:hypothetical protein